MARATTPKPVASEIVKTTAPNTISSMSLGLDKIDVARFHCVSLSKIL